MKNNRQSFTLVEMMIAVTILAVGIVLVLRSLLNAVSTLDYIQNRMTAITFLENKMNILEQTAVEEKGVKIGSAEEEALVGNRKAVFTSQIEIVEMEKLKEDQQKMDKATLKVLWQEGGNNRDAALVTYLPEKK